MVNELRDRLGPVIDMARLEDTISAATSLRSALYIIPTEHTSSRRASYLTAGPCLLGGMIDDYTTWCWLWIIIGMEHWKARSGIGPMNVALVNDLDMDRIFFIME